MKTTAVRLLCLLALCAPQGAWARKNIKAAFDAIINCPQAEIKDSHFLSKNKETKIKDGRDDIYDFELPAGKSNLIEDVWSAFDKDETAAYVVKTGRNTGASSVISLHSEDSSTYGSYGIPIDAPGSDYIYALFVPSEGEDPYNAYRYAYGFNCKEEDGFLKGRMVINYATTSEYRRKAEQEDRIRHLVSLENAHREAEMVETQQSWFEMVMSCINAMDGIPEKTQNSLATKLYNLVSEVKSFPEVTTYDKQTVLSIIIQMGSLPQYSSSPIVSELLRRCQIFLN